MAVEVSLAENSGHVPIRDEVAGSWTEKVFPEDEGTHSPFT